MPERGSEILKSAVLVEARQSIEEFSCFPSDLNVY